MPKELTAGGLSVTFMWGIDGEAKALDFWLFQGGDRCPDADEPVPEGALRTDHRPRLPDEAIAFGPLPADVHYTLVIRGQYLVDAIAVPMVRGCADGLQVAGRYDVRSRVDLADAAAALLAKPFAEFQDEVDETPEEIADALAAGVREFTGADGAIPEASREEAAA